jgi:hypothetical protein
MLRISWIAGNRLASQEELCYMELFISAVCILCNLMNRLSSIVRQYDLKFPTFEMRAAVFCCQNTTWPKLVIDNNTNEEIRNFIWAVTNTYRWKTVICQTKQHIWTYKLCDTFLEKGVFFSTLVVNRESGSEFFNARCDMQICSYNRGQRYTRWARSLPLCMCFGRFSLPLLCSSNHASLRWCVNVCGCGFGGVVSAPKRICFCTERNKISTTEKV